MNYIFQIMMRKNEEYTQRKDNDYCHGTELYFVNHRTNTEFPVDLINSSGDGVLNPCNVISSNPDGSHIAFTFNLGYDSLYEENLTGTGILNTTTNKITRLYDFDAFGAGIAFHPTKNLTGVLALNALSILNENFEEVGYFELLDEDYIISWAFVPNKELVAFLNDQGHIIFYSFKGEKLYELIEGSYSNSFGFSPNGTYCYKQTDNNGVYIWDLTNESEALPKWSYDKWIVKFAKRFSANARFSSDGKYIVDRIPSDSILVRDWRNKTVIAKYGPIDSLSSKQLFYHENGMLGHLSSYKDIMMQREGGPLLYGANPTYQEQDVLAVCLSADGRQLYVAHKDEIKIMDPQGEIIDSLFLGSSKGPSAEDAGRVEPDSLANLNDVSYMQLAVSANNKFLAISINGKVELYDLLKKQFIREIGTQLSTDKIAINSTGELIATLNQSTLQLWDNQGTELDYTTDTLFMNPYDMKFAEDDQHILIFAARGVLSWGSTKLLLEAVQHLGLDNPSLLKEVDVVLNSTQIVRGPQDTLFWKRIFFGFMVSVIGLILLNRITNHFDRKEYLKVGYYAPIFGLMIFIQLVSVFEVYTREELHEALDAYLIVNAPFFFSLTTQVYRYWKEKDQIRSYVFLGINIFGMIGALIFLYLDYYSFINPEFWYIVLAIFFIIGIILIPLHKAVKHWYEGKKKRFWFYTGILILELLLVIVLA